jgi:EPS-associated MarR family transcriptional regulator
MEYDIKIIKLLKAIEKNPNTSQRELAKSLAISVGKTNYVLKELSNKGLIKIKRFLNSYNKWAYMYILTPDGIKEKSKITKEFVQKKIKEYEELLKDEQD